VGIFPVCVQLVAPHFFVDSDPFCVPVGHLQIAVGYELWYAWGVDAFYARAGMYWSAAWTRLPFRLLRSMSGSQHSDAKNVLVVYTLNSALK
jgi:hypothetical protein